MGGGGRKKEGKRVISTLLSVFDLTSSLLHPFAVRSAAHLCAGGAIVSSAVLSSFHSFSFMVVSGLDWLRF
jgi:hypothetical protein